MITAVVAGNIGKDAQLRQAGGQQVCSFGVASSSKRGDNETTTWIDCSIWGSRGEKLAKHLTKGSRVAVSGELGTREHNGKTYLTLRVDQLEFMGGKRSDDSTGASNGNTAPARSTEYDAPADDDIPF